MPQTKKFKSSSEEDNIDSLVLGVIAVAIKYININNYEEIVEFCSKVVYMSPDEINGVKSEIKNLLDHDISLKDYYFSKVGIELS